MIVTQNVDGLHEAGGATGVLHMHGQLDQALCAVCGHRWAAPTDLLPQHPCPSCAALSGRPDVVWFGEIPYHMELIQTHLAEARFFAAIGTSGQVSPAAGFVMESAAHGAHTVELNLDPTPGGVFDETRTGPATQEVPDWVETLLCRLDKATTGP